MLIFNWSSKSTVARWWNWQTRWTQNPVSSRVWEFESPPGHQMVPPLTGNYTNRLQTTYPTAQRPNTSKTTVASIIQLGPRFGAGTFSGIPMALQKLAFALVCLQVFCTQDNRVWEEIPLYDNVCIERVPFSIFVLYFSNILVFLYISNSKGFEDSNTL